MADLIFKIAYFAGLVVEIIIRAPVDRQRRRDPGWRRQLTGQEAAVLALLSLGGFVLPVVYVFTPWLSFSDYDLADWAGWLGVAVLIAALAVFWRAHADLGQNWSPTVELREGHTLVTNGIYGAIRHPMYASQWLYGIAQALLLHNWIAGAGGLLLFLPLYFLRMPREEQMMVDAFGEEYRAYMGRTGRVLPRWRGA
jgi:protein-S-isoprenylcysteine O-methyltransferase Ste14